MQPPIEIDLDPFDLQDEIHQKLMATLLHYGEHQLAMREPIAKAFQAVESFKTKFSYTDVNAVRKLNNIVEDLEKIEKLVITTMRFEEDGSRVTALCNEFLKILKNKNLNKRDIEDLAKRITQFLEELEKHEAKIQYAKYTKLTEDKSYPVYIGDQLYLVKIPDYSLFLRRRGQGKAGCVYEVSRSDVEKLGSGNFATVIPLVGKVKETFHGVSSVIYGGEDTGEYILKKSTRGAWDLVEPESEVLHRASHAHSKPAILGKRRGGIVMQYLPEEDLSKFLKSNEGLESYFFIDLIRNILQAYKSQIYDKKIIHRDIKPPNIRIKINWSDEEMQTEQLSYIDFNLSQLKEKTTPNISGTSKYLTPEMLKGNKQTTASDIYALAIIFTQIISKMCPDDNLRQQFSQIWKSMPTKQFPTLAQVITFRKELIRITQKMLRATELPKALQREMAKLVENMLSERPGSRPSIETLIKRIEQAEAVYHQSKEYREVEAKVRSTRKRLTQLEEGTLKHTIIILSDDPLENLKNIILDSCSRINEGDSLKRFLRKLGIKALRDLETQEDVAERIDNIHAAFITTMNSLLGLYENLERIENYKLSDPDLLEITALKKEVGEVIEKHRKYPLNLDNLVVLTARLERRRIIIAKQVENINQKIDAESQEVDYFKRRIRETIEQYVNKSDVRFNHLFHRRAFSSKRIEQINQIITIINSDKDLNTLISEVGQVTSKISSGSFPGSKSELKDNLLRALQEFEQNEYINVDKLSQ